MNTVNSFKGLKPVRKGFLLPLMFLLTLLSGFTIPIGVRGYLPIASVFFALYVCVYCVSYNLKLSNKRFYEFILLIIILLINGSPLTTTVLVIFNILTLFILNPHIKRIYDQKDEALVFIIVLLTICFAFFSLIVMPDSFLWSKYAPHEVESKLIPVRLKLFFIEPSHLGIFSAIMYFLSKKTLSKFLFLTTLALTGSLLGLVFFLILKFKKYPLTLLIAFVVGLMVFISQALNNPALVFTNSGTVRLIGAIHLFNNLEPLKLFLGFGLGSGDQALLPIFKAIGVDQANGFIFSSIYDLGIGATVLFFKIFCVNIFDVLILILLLLNFGLGSFLLVVFLLMAKKINLLT
ncbi:hypothetical protein OAC13_01580 [bacterium]|nr:hypothetical protein [bacterium]